MNIMANDIFISYRREGGFATANHLNDMLKHDGYSVSFDMDSLGSGNFDTALLKLIDDCTDFILICNDKVFERSLDPTCERKYDWVRNELAYALEKKKNIIPVMLDGFTEFPKNLPADIAEVAHKNAVKYSMEYFYDGFYNKLKRLLQSRPQALPNVQPFINVNIPHANAQSTSSDNNKNLKKIGYIAVALIALIWIFAKPGHSDKSENQEESAIEVVDETPTGVEANVVGANNRTSTQRTQTPKATPSANTSSESNYSQQPSAGNSTHAETPQPASPTPTQSAALSEPTPAAPAAAPVELSASELLSKGRSAVKKFKASEGADYFKQAIAKGSVEANYYLGELYYSGNGVAKSFPTAKSYFQKAAQAGMADAQYMMGVMYRNGQGGDKDLDQARTWLQKAASQGNANAERLLNQIK